MLKPFACSCLMFLLTLPAVSQIFIGSPSQVNASIFNSGLQNAMQTAMAGTASRAELEARLGMARNDYWKLVSEGKDATAAGAEYLKFLRQKDFYLFQLEFSNYFDKDEPGNDNNGGKSIRGLGDAIDYLFGKWIKGTDLDGGVHPFAKGAFTTWAFTASRPAYLFSDSGMRKIQELYVDYCKKRDTAEFLFRNPYSQLESGDPEQQLKFWLYAVRARGSFSDAEAYVNEIKAQVGKDKLPGLSAYARTLIRQDDFSRKGFFTDRENGTYYCLEKLDWYLAKNDPSLVLLYHIKRRNRCSYPLAKLILEQRIARYGKARIDACRDSLLKYINSDRPPYGGDPESSDLRALPITDGLAELLGGQNEIWKDMAGLGKNKMSFKGYRDILVRCMEEGDQADPNHRRSMNERYSELFKVVNMNLLEAAVAADEDFPSGRLTGHGIGYGTDNSVGKEARVNNIFRMYYGLSIDHPDPQTFAVLLIRDGEKGGQTERLEKAVTIYQELCAKYGKEQVLKVASEVRKQVSPNRFDAKFVLTEIPFRSANLDDEPLVRLKNKLVPAAAVDLKVFEELHAKYRQKGKAYLQSPQPPGERFRGDYPFNFRHTRVIYSDDEFILRSDLFSRKNILILKVGAETSINNDSIYVIRFRELIEPILEANLGNSEKAGIAKPGTRLYIPVYLENYTEEQINYVVGHIDPRGPNLIDRPINISQLRIDGGNWVAEPVLGQLDKAFGSFSSLLGSLK